MSIETYIINLNHILTAIAVILGIYLSVSKIKEKYKLDIDMVIEDFYVKAKKYDRPKDTHSFNAEIDYTIYNRSNKRKTIKKIFLIQEDLKNATLSQDLADNFIIPENSYVSAGGYKNFIVEDITRDLIVKIIIQDGHNKGYIGNLRIHAIIPKNKKELDLKDINYLNNVNFALFSPIKFLKKMSKRQKSRYFTSKLVLSKNIKQSKK